MTFNNLISRKWYLTLIAAYFLIVCGLTSMRYLSMDTSLNAGSIPVTTQVLCHSATIAAILYFIRPVIGCAGLLAVCGYALVLSLLSADSESIVFYCILVSILVIPLLGLLRNQGPKT